MIKREEKAWQHFKELKCFLPKQSLLLWKGNFKHYIDKFIEEHLDEKLFITAILCEDREEEEQTASTSTGSNIWWLVPSKNRNWCSNPSMRLYVLSLTVHFYGKVEGM